MLAANPPKCPFFLTHSLPLSSSPSPSFKITCSAAAEERSVIRLGLPNKGRMAADTLDLLKDCQLSVKHINPRQYVAKIPELSNLEVWFQRPKDIVRKLLSGDLDLGIAGLDTVSEYGQMGIADAILDLGSSGIRLKKKRKKQFERDRGRSCVAKSSKLSGAVLVASKRSLLKMESASETTHEILERLEAHLKAEGQYTVVANMRGNGAQEVTEDSL